LMNTVIIFAFILENGINKENQPVRSNFLT